jgi:hypothetical protein
MENLDRYLNKQNSKVIEKILDDGAKEVCDIITGECSIYQEKDGLIERTDNYKISNKHIKVKTVAGIKELLND